MNIIKVNPHIPVTSEDAPDVRYFCREGFSLTYDAYREGYNTSRADLLKELGDLKHFLDCVHRTLRVKHFAEYEYGADFMEFKFALQTLDKIIGGKE